MIRNSTMSFMPVAISLVFIANVVIRTLTRVVTESMPDYADPAYAARDNRDHLPIKA